jgi:hypothetical protein
VRRLIAEILRDNRVYPIIGFMLSDGKARPVLTPQEVRGIASERTRVYLIVGEYQRVQGTKLGPACGPARVWWPEYGARATGSSSGLQHFGHELELSRPAVRREIDRLAGDLATSGHKLAEAHESNIGLKRDLRAAEIDERRAVVRADAAQQMLGETRAYLKPLEDAGLDSNELRMIAQMDQEDRLLHRLILENGCVWRRAIDVNTSAWCSPLARIIMSKIPKELTCHE